MSILKQLGYKHIEFRLPERLTPDEIRRRRLAAVLERHQKELEARTDRLSPANNFHLQKLKEFQRKFQPELEARKREINRLYKSDPSVRTRALKVAMFGYFQLQTRQSELLKRAASEKRRNALFGQAIGANRNYFHPSSWRNPRAIYGTEAKVTVNASSRKMFRRPEMAFPCVQRLIRKQVMFAFGYAGKGYRTRKRFGPFSEIGC